MLKPMLAYGLDRELEFSLVSGRSSHFYFPVLPSNHQLRMIHVSPISVRVPNHAQQPTLIAVTFRAYARNAPAISAAELKR